MSLRLSRKRKTPTTTVRREILIRTQTLTLVLILFSTLIPTLLPNVMMTPTLPSIMNLNPLPPPILNPTLATILVLLMNWIQAQMQKRRQQHLAMMYPIPLLLTVLQRIPPAIRLLCSSKTLSLLQMTRLLSLILPPSPMIRWPGLSHLPQWWPFPSLVRPQVPQPQWCHLLAPSHIPLSYYHSQRQ